MDAILDVFAGHVKDGEKKILCTLSNALCNPPMAFQGNVSMSMTTGYFAIHTYADSQEVQVSGGLRLGLT
ncbi:hypothetical protein BLL42_02470 [Pseudomonas frederiksbergensis]|uniref:Uncharacterized protein n=1 Tax=Pseudomonas frederiksbergensis TaxID=104087 RepID=A0A1J0EEW7_9PSED|nr:hypothetical protein [Pseudomonas frederiksbergensis]APC14650.1 hypothetical protein BLL42_02470 [Pseudomonas frederiksbergensis]